MDGYLRGITANSENNIWTAYTLYGQYPAGFDLRLSIDLRLQKIADENLANHTGAVVLMNASSGEILTMSTSPTFNADLLEENWEIWMEDDTAPLLNRATQGLYPPGSAIGGVVLARFLANNTMSPSIPDQDWSINPESPNFCAVLPGDNITWGKLISSGCISVLTTFSKSLPLAEVMDLMSQTGLYQEPSIPLESSPPVIPDKIQDYKSLYTGTTNFLVSPLQMAVMAASLSNEGLVLSPQITVAYKSLDNEWVLFDQGVNSTTIPDYNASDAVSKLTQGNFPGWEISALARNENAAISWYIAGTPPDWHSTPLTIVVALENASPSEARSIGRQVFLSAISRSYE